MALGSGTFSAAGGAVNDLFSGFGHGKRAEGLDMESGNYDQAAILSDLNARYTRESTAIKEAQQQRSLGLVLGQQRADVAASGFADSGSAIDIMRDSASQGALTKAVIGQQGLITEAGFKEQAAAYRIMADASRMAADAERTAETGAYISAGIKGASAIGSLFI